MTKYFFFIFSRKTENSTYCCVQCHRIFTEPKLASVLDPLTGKLKIASSKLLPRNNGRSTDSVRIASASSSFTSDNCDVLKLQTDKKKNSSTAS